MKIITNEEIMLKRKNKKDEVSMRLKEKLKEGYDTVMASHSSLTKYLKYKIARLQRKSDKEEGSWGKSNGDRW